MGLARKLAMFEQLGGPEARRVAEAFWTAPNAETWAVYNRVCMHLYNTQPPRDADAARMLDESLSCIVALTEDDTAPPVLSMYDENGPPSVSQQRVDDFGAAIWAVYDLRQLWKSLGPRVEQIRKAQGATA